MNHYYLSRGGSVAYAYQFAGPATRGGDSDEC